jgi:hypothetical protein
VKRRILVAITAAVLNLGWLLHWPTPIRRSGQATEAVQATTNAILRARRQTRLAASRSRSTEALCGLGIHSRGHTPARSDQAAGSRP